MNMTHIESRPSLSNPGAQYDFYIDCDCDRKTLVQLVEDLKKFAVSVSIKTMSPEEEDEGGYCAHLCTVRPHLSAHICSG